MSQFYTDPTRENDDHAIPDAEVFQMLLCEVYCSECDNTFEAANPQCGAPWAICPDCAREVRAADFIKPIGPRWYWQSCFPGCLPDSDPVGPFDTEEEAVADAQDY
jgi:hypothetical protein